MASRSQMRLAQITGSLSSAETEIAALGTDSLQGVMDHLASAIKRITGGSAYHSQAAGQFSQALTGSAGLKLAGDLDVDSSADIAGAVNLQSTLAVAGQADFANNAVVASGYVYKGDLEYQLTASNGIVMAAAFKNDANRSFALDVDYTHAQFGVSNTDSIDMTYSAGQFSADLNLASGDALEILAGGLELKSAITGSRTFKDAISMESTLGVDGKGTFNGEIQVIGAADLDGALDVQGAANFQNTVTVAGAADLNGALDVQGAANFQDNVVVAGNLTVNGTTTTVNTEEVTIADHNIVIDSNNSTAAVINGAGFTFDGGSGDDLTFQWNTSDSDMELKLGTAFAKLHIGNLDAADIAAANITLSANISAVDGDFTGNVSVGGTLGVTGAATLSDALSVAGAADIGGALDVSGIISGSSDMELTGNGQFLANIDVDGTATLFDVTIEDLSAGRLVATDASKNLISIDLDNWISGTPNQVNVTDVSSDGKVTLSTPQDIDTDADVEFDSLILGDMVAADIGRALKVGSAGLVSAATWDEFIAIEANVGLELAVHAGGFKAEIGLAQDIRTTASPEFAALNIGSDGDISIDGSNLVIDAPNGQLVFDDAHKASSTWSVGTPFELAADDAAWQSYIDSVGEVSLLEGIANAAQGSLDAGKWYYLVSSTVSVGSSVALSGMTSFADASTSPRAADVAYGNLPGVVASKVADVYVNGQLMMPGSDKDYVINASQEFEFKFQLEDQDIIQLVIR
jgi:hypothetical protein